MATIIPSKTKSSNGSNGNGATPIELIRPAAPITDQPVIESMRLLALNVNRLLANAQRRSVVVLSAHPNDGRSLVSTTLAGALAEVCPRVLLVKADPIGSDHDLASQIGNAGIDGWLQVADCGRFAPRPQVEFVETVTDVIEHGLKNGATVVVDTPACTTSTVAFHLAAAAGGVLYLARRTAPNADVHHDIRAELELLGANILGVVFNEA